MNKERIIELYKEKLKYYLDDSYYTSRNSYDALRQLAWDEAKDEYVDEMLEGMCYRDVK